MDPTTGYNDWFEKALKDLSSARVYREHNSAYEVTTFHCHQAVEKALKGYLLGIGEGLIDSHDLLFLAKNAEKTLHKLTLHKNDLALVNKHYLEMTYPDDMRYEVSAEIADTCIAITEHILSLIIR